MRIQLVGVRSGAEAGWRAGTGGCWEMLLGRGRGGGGSGVAAWAGGRWLASGGWLGVGRRRLDPWRYAMGWSEVAARSHARRLERQGWLERSSDDLG